MRRYLSLIVPVLVALAFAGAARAERITVAVAANFLPTARALADAFGAASGHEVVLAHGATGALYAQIRNGAPFDLFLAADAARPELLEAEGRVAPGGRRAYALGRLALAGPGLEPGADWRALIGTGARRLALANPRTAPYGAAARELLIALRGEAGWDRGVIFGESVGQAFAFVVTGNAELGLVALSLVRQPGHALGWVEIPATAYPPIRQEAVLLARAADNPAAAGFFDYLSTPAARSLIAAAGYGLPAP